MLAENLGLQIIMYTQTWLFFFLISLIFPTKTVEVGWTRLFQWEIPPAYREVLGWVGKQDTMTLSSLSRLGSGSALAWLSVHGSFAQSRVGSSWIRAWTGEFLVHRDICRGMLWIPYTSCASCYFFTRSQLICLPLFGTEQLRLECTYGPYCAHGRPGTDLFRCDASDL